MKELTSEGKTIEEQYQEGEEAEDEEDQEQAEETIMCVSGSRQPKPRQLSVMKILLQAHRTQWYHSGITVAGSRGNASGTTHPSQS